MRRGLVGRHRACLQGRWASERTRPGSMRDHLVRERCRELWASGATPTADQLAEVEVALRRAGYDNDLVLSRAVAQWHARTWGWGPEHRSEHLRLLAGFEDVCEAALECFEMIEGKGPAEYVLAMRACPDYQTAHKLLCRMEAAGYPPDVSCFEALMKSCARGKDVSTALSLLRAMAAAAVPPTAGCYEEVAAAAVACLRVDALLDAYRRSREVSPPSDRMCRLLMLSTTLPGGGGLPISVAEAAFDEVVRSNNKATPLTYQTMLGVYEHHGCEVKAEALRLRMQRMRVPDRENLKKVNQPITWTGASKWDDCLKHCERPPNPP
ncbi:hypothetical protein DIPPA_02450 [Diplonema papillatum]|nr:hypothetical protein DIPPA_02450 [Diplonema papillatum]